MGRAPRCDVGGLCYHALNRGNARRRVFDTDGDFEAFELLLQEAVARWMMRVCAYVLMPTHWHLVLWPRNDGELARFVGWLTLTHTQRWHAYRQSAGLGHVYQGRFKSFPIEEDAHFLAVCRYVERNPLRAGLVPAGAADQWRWSSLWRRQHGGQGVLLADWPVERPGTWLARVNQAETAEELEALRQSVGRNRPYGSAAWVEQTCRTLGLDTTLRSRGRPSKLRERILTS